VLEDLHVALPRFIGITLMGIGVGIHGTVRRIDVNSQRYKFKISNPKNVGSPGI